MFVGGGDARGRPVEEFPAAEPMAQRVSRAPATAREAGAGQGAWDRTLGWGAVKCTREGSGALQQAAQSLMWQEEGRWVRDALSHNGEPVSEQALHQRKRPPSCRVSGTKNHLV